MALPTLKWRRRMGPIALTATSAAAVYRLAGQAQARADAIAALVVLGAGTFLSRRPRVAAAVSLSVVIVMPIYWGRTGSLGLPLIPALVAAVLALPAAVRAARGFRWTALDVTVAVHLGLVAVSLLLITSAGLSGPIALVARAGLPFVAFRMLSRDRRTRDSMAATVLTSGAVLAVVSSEERRTGNFFTQVSGGGYEAIPWTLTEFRFDQVRLESSFGHPIAFGLFLALAITLGVGQAAAGRASGFRVAAVILATVALIGTLSRGAIMVCILGVIFIVATTLFRIRPASLVATMAVVAVLFLVTPLQGLLEEAGQSVRSAETATSVRYRQQLFEAARQPAAFSLLGRDIASNPLTTSSGRQLVSIDNEFVLVFVRTGILGLLSLVAVGLLVVQIALKRDLPALDRSWAAAALASIIGIVFVALLTQHQTIFWIVLATVASIDENRQASVREPSGEEPLQLVRR